MISWNDVAPASNEPLLRADRIEEARLLLKLATEFRRDGWPDKARRYARRALSIFERESRADLDGVRARLCLAGAREDLGDYPRAQADLQLAEEALGQLTAVAESLEAQALRVQMIRGLASVLLALGDRRQAEAMLKRALGVAHRAFGSDHAEVAAVMHDLGVLYTRTGLYDEASRLQHLALAITKKALGSQHLQGAAILFHLGLLEHARGRFAVGEAFARRAAAIRHSALGPDHLQVAEALASVGTLLEGQKKHFDATLHRKRARVIRERCAAHAGKDAAGSSVQADLTATERTQPHSAADAPADARCA